MSWQPQGVGLWQAAALTADFAGAVFYRINAGTMLEFGGLMNAVTGGLLTAFTLPVGFRPPADAFGSRTGVGVALSGTVSPCFLNSAGVFTTNPAAGQAFSLAGLQMSIGVLA